MIPLIYGIKKSLESRKENAWNKSMSDRVKSYTIHTSKERRFQKTGTPLHLKTFVSAKQAFCYQLYIILTATYSFIDTQLINFSTAYLMTLLSYERILNHELEDKDVLK